MALEPVSLVAGLAAFLPGLAAIFVLYGPFDGYFRDNVVFLWFVGGLLLGTPVALLGAWVLALSPPLFYVLGAPLLEQGAKLVFLNRRKWQGERHAVWNGGAIGAGIGTMIALVYAYQTFAVGFDGTTAFAVVAAAIGIGFVHVATGLALGAGVSERRPFGAYGLAALATAPLTFLLFGDRLFAGTDVPAVLFPILVAVYGIAAIVLSRYRWLPHGVGPDELRRIRRKERAARRE